MDCSGSGARFECADLFAERKRVRGPAMYKMAIPPPTGMKLNNSAANMGSNVDIASAPGIRTAADLNDVLAPGRRITSGGAVA